MTTNSWAQYVARVKENEEENPALKYESTKKENKTKKLILSSEDDDKSPFANKHMDLLQQTRMGATTFKLNSSRESSEASTPRFSMSSSSLNTLNKVKSRPSQSLLSFLSAQNSKDDTDDEDERTKQPRVLVKVNRNRNRPPPIVTTQPLLSSFSMEHKAQNPASSKPLITTSVVPDSSNPFATMSIVEPPMPILDLPPPEKPIVPVTQSIVKQPAIEPKKVVTLNKLAESKWEFQPPSTSTALPLTSTAPFVSPPGTPKPKPAPAPYNAHVYKTGSDTQVLSLPNSNINSIPSLNNMMQPENISTLSIDQIPLSASLFTMIPKQNYRADYYPSATRPSWSTPKSVGRLSPSYFELQRRKRDADDREYEKGLAWFAQSISTSSTRPFGYIPHHTIVSRHKQCCNASYVNSYSTESSVDSAICSSA